MKNSYYYTLFMASILLLFSSCISSEETNYLQQIDIAYKPVPFEEYILQTGDKITCAISTKDQEFISEFNSLINATQTQGKSYIIYEDGNIIIPFFGTMKIAGLTIQNAEKMIKEKMRESITDVQVKIGLTNNTFIMYANEKQGMYNVYKENLTIFQALAISGQTTERMDLSNVTVMRMNEHKQTISRTFDLRAQSIIESEFYYIKPNDVIYFRTNKNAFYNVTSLGSFLSTMQYTITVLGTLLLTTQINKK